MKKLRSILALLLTIAIMASFAVINASAAFGDSMLCVNSTDGVCIEIDGYDAEAPHNTILKYNDNTLSVSTDWTHESNKIIFSQAFMSANYIKDLKKITVNIDSTDYDVNLYHVNKTKDEVLNYETKASNITGKDTEKILKYFDKKGLLKENSSNGITTYSLNDKVVYTIDTNKDIAYPADVNAFDNIVSLDLTFADSFELCKLGATDEIKLCSTIITMFGTRAVVDLSSFEPGVSTLLVDKEDFRFAELYIMSLSYLQAGGKIVLEEEEVNKDVDKYIVKDLQGNTLAVFTLDDDKDTLSVLITEGLTAKDNVITNYYDEDEGFNVIAGLIFKKPEVISGNNTTWRTGDGDLTFKSSANFDELERVVLDGEELDPSNYTKKEGSTIITLKKSFTSTLNKGKHTLDIVSYSGTATATFTIASPEDDKIAQTGDNSAIGAFAAIATFSTLAFVSLKKKES